MKFLPIALLLSVACGPLVASAKTPKAVPPPPDQSAAPSVPKVFRGPGVTFTYDGAFFKAPKVYRQKAVRLVYATDKPDGVAPAHVAIQFARGLGDLEIFPTTDREVKDFRRAYPTHADAEKRLRRVLRDRPTRVNDMPALPWADVSMPFHTKIRYLDFRSGSGVAWLTQRTIDTAPINNAQLWYVFQGLTRDGQYYVSAQIHVTHASLSGRATVQDYDRFEKQYPAYLAQAVHQLSRQPDASFLPPLARLRAMFASIEVAARRAAASAGRIGGMGIRFPGAGTSTELRPNTPALQHSSTPTLQHCTAPPGRAFALHPCPRGLCLVRSMLRPLFFRPLRSAGLLVLALACSLRLHATTFVIEAAQLELPGRSGRPSPHPAMNSRTNISSPGRMR